MKIRIAIFGISALALMLAASFSASALTDQEKAEGFVSLFDGETLDGWIPMGSPESWTVQNGIMVCSGEGGGWIRTDKMYKDFILRMDFRIPDGGNSGVFLRATEEGNPAFTGLEVQILGDHGGPASVHSTGSIYDGIAPSANLSRPGGQWNSYEIIYIGNSIKVSLNGRTIIVADLFDSDFNEGLADDRKFTTRAPTGYIGMQNHGSKVEFRNIRLRNFVEYQEPANP